MTEYDTKMNGERSVTRGFPEQKKRTLLPERASFGAAEAARGSGYISSTSL